MSSSIPLSALGRVHPREVRRQPTGRLPRCARSHGRDDAGHDEGDELLGIDVHSTCRAARYRHPHAHFHPGVRDAHGGPPHGGIRIRIGAYRRHPSRPAALDLRPQHRAYACGHRLGGRLSDVRVDDAAAARVRADCRGRRGCGSRHRRRRRGDPIHAPACAGSVLRRAVRVHPCRDPRGRRRRVAQSRRLQQAVRGGRRRQPRDVRLLA